MTNSNQVNEKIILTYETIYEILRKEKSKDELQKLDEGFLANALAYLREKQLLYDEAMRKSDIFSVADREKLSIQLYNIRKLVRELYERREKKVLDMAMNRSRTNSAVVDTSNLLNHERELFSSFVEVLDKFRNGVLHTMLELKEPTMVSMANTICQPAPAGDAIGAVNSAAAIDGAQQASALQTAAGEQEETRKTKFVKFVQPVEQFVGSELELYGPFECEAKAYLPTDIADILINDGRATEIEDD
jgi:DNA replication initiation complex subunit (GINS family)